jgi:glycerophosphoryl diester phosphodiesterase
VIYPLVRVAHRGASAEYPENTMMAFRRAIEIGVDALEVDVHLTYDGVLVVMHDSTLDRTTDGTGFVRDHSWQAISQLNAGQGERVPMLIEVIELARSTDMRLCIEIKGAIPADEIKVAEAVVQILDRTGYADKVIITSFYGVALRRVREMCPTLSTMLDPSPQDGSLTLRQICEQVLQAGANSLSYDGRFVTPEVAAGAHLAGIALWPLIQESMGDMRALIRLGVPGIMTDRPDLLNKVLAEEAAAT